MQADQDENHDSSKATSNKRPLASKAASESPSLQQQEQAQQPIEISNGDNDNDNDNHNDNHNHNDNGEPLTKKAKTEETIKLNAKPNKSIFGSSTTSGFAAFGSSTSKDTRTGTDTSTGTGTGTTTGTTTTTGFGSNTATNSIFGSSTASGFGLGQSSTSATGGFGITSSTRPGIFGSTSATTGKSLSTFATKTSTDKAFETTTNTNNSIGIGIGIHTTSLSKGSAAACTPIISLPIMEDEEPIKNGEENEETIITVRAKLFKLTKVKKVTVDAPSRLPRVEKTVGIQMATKVGQYQQSQSPSRTEIEENDRHQPTDSSNGNATNANANADENGASASASASASGKKGSAIAAAMQMDWKEIGIGPLRVLTDDKHARIVQRRENTPGGQGTKLILNLALRDECRWERKGEKFVKLAAFEVVEDDNDGPDGGNGTTSESESKNEEKGKNGDGQHGNAVKFVSVQYLFKVKTIAEADSMVEALERYCGGSGTN